MPLATIRSMTPTTTQEDPMQPAIVCRHGKRADRPCRLCDPVREARRVAEIQRLAKEAVRQYPQMAKFIEYMFGKH